MEVFIEVKAVPSYLLVTSVVETVDCYLGKDIDFCCSIDYPCVIELFLECNAVLFLTLLKFWQDVRGSNLMGGYTSKDSSSWYFKSFKVISSTSFYFGLSLFGFLAALLDVVVFA